MQRFIRKPSIDMYVGIKVDKDTKLEFENENVKQKLENLVFHSASLTFLTVSISDSSSKNQRTPPAFFIYQLFIYLL